MKTHTAPNSLFVQRLTVSGRPTSVVVVCKDKQALASYPAYLQPGRNIPTMAQVRTDAQWNVSK